MEKWVVFLCFALVAVAACTSQADWCETLKDGTAGGGLDYDGYWVAAWNGSTPNPASDWYTATELSSWFGTDAGWHENVINISDGDATAYVAENKVESFSDVRSTVSVSTSDLDEEFGVMVRASAFDHGDSIAAVTGYAATFSANNAAALGDPMKFTLYKIVDGVIDYSVVKNPGVPAVFDDLIAFIELTAEGDTITARLFDDAESSSPLETITWQDTDGPLTSGYTGVVNLDWESANGLDSYYDTLCSVAIPEPATVFLLGLGGVLLRRRRKLKS